MFLKNLENLKKYFSKNLENFEYFKKSSNFFNIFQKF